MHIIFSRKVKSKFRSLEIPTLKVTFDYQDIADSRHKASFDIDLSPIAFSADVLAARLESKKR